ncbi:MAG: GNAT family N-acetyltransferase [Planctomycetota bacterium]|nr:GNAT family N-acetyltransferase [Planctomycetota bacterium]
MIFSRTQAKTKEQGSPWAWKRALPGVARLLPGERGLSSELRTRGLVIRHSSPEEDEQRDRYVRSHPASTVFHLSGWARAVESAFRAGRRDLIALEGERIVGVLPLASCRRALGGRNWISAPWGVYGGPIASRPEIAERLVCAAQEWAADAGARRLELRCLEDPHLSGFSASDLYVTFRKRLPEREEDVLRTFPRTERKYLRQAVERHGLSIEEGHHLRHDLARLFLSSKRTLGSPGLPARWWEALEAELGAEYVLHGARRGDELLGVTLTFLHRQEAAMYYVGTAPEANRRYHTTTYMIASCMEWSVRHGYELFDLGRSRRDSGACTFKINQGFEPTPLHYRHALLGAGAKIPSFTPSNPKTAFLRKTWSQLPIWACDTLSRRLATFLP